MNECSRHYNTYIYIYKSVAKEAGARTVKWQLQHSRHRYRAPESGKQLFQKPIILPRSLDQYCVLHEYRYLHIYFPKLAALYGECCIEK